MKGWLFSMMGLGALLVLAACAAEEKAAPAAPKPEAAAPAAPEARPAWQEEWERVLAAAKQEGKVAILGLAGTERRQALSEGFEKRYGIKVEYLGGRGPEYNERLRLERGAGQYLWDINIGGLTHWVPVLGQGLFDPIEPALILPEVKDPKSWQDGGLLWLDDKRTILAMTLSTTTAPFINANLVKPAEIKSWKDLLDPKWKGKMISDDPRIAGGGLSQYTFFYRHPDLGPNFVRALLKHDLTITRDRDQQLEWLAHGRYHILVGGSGGRGSAMIKQGLPIAYLDPRRVKEGWSVAVGSGHLFLINRAPHPNATKVYINWLLSKEGQTAFSLANDTASLRVDVPTDHLESWSVPQKGYMRQIGVEDEQMREVMRKFAEELLGR